MNLRHVFGIRPKRIGIALSGGAARGAAHIGVLRVLEEAGITPQIVAGTSAGAIVGAAYAAGLSVEKISQLFKEASWPKLAKIAWKDALSLFNTQPMESFLRSQLGDFDFCQLPRKFACVACDILTGEKIVFTQGSVAAAVRASAAFPGVFSPIHQEKQLLIDGGVVDNLPVDVVRDLKADYVIAVDLSTPIHLAKPPASIFDLLYSVSNLMQSRSALPDPTSADCYIKPDVRDLSAWTFGETAELEKRGEAAARKMIAKLKADLRIRR